MRILKELCLSPMVYSYIDDVSYLTILCASTVGENAEGVMSASNGIQ